MINMCSEYHHCSAKSHVVKCLVIALDKYYHACVNMDDFVSQLCVIKSLNIQYSS